MIDKPKNVKDWLALLLPPLQRSLHHSTPLRKIVAASQEEWANAAMHAGIFGHLLLRGEDGAAVLARTILDATWQLHHQLTEQQSKPKGYNDDIVRLIDKLQEATAMPPGQELTDNQSGKLIGVGLAKPGCRVRIDWMDAGLSDIGCLIYTPFNYDTDPVRAGIVHIPKPRLERAGAAQGPPVWITVHSLAKSERVVWIHFDPPADAYN